jgi:glutaredoxin
MKITYIGEQGIRDSEMERNTRGTMELTVELVPQSSWGNNLRTEANIPKSEWDKLRKSSYKKANYKCEICSGKGKKWPVECHEIWEYDDKTHTQTLKGLISLCPTCHKAKHLGRTLSVEPQHIKDQVLLKMVELNNMTPNELEDYIVEVFETWQRRSQHKWTLDLSWLDKARGGADD